MSCLISEAGEGISHAIGVGGRDLKQEIGGITTLMAIDALDADPETDHVVLISKPPHPDVAKAVLARIGKSPKPYTVCFIGAASADLPPNARFAGDAEGGGGKGARRQPAHRRQFRCRTLRPRACRGGEAERSASKVCLPAARCAPRRR